MQKVDGDLKRKSRIYFQAQPGKDAKDALGRFYVFMFAQ